MLQELIDAIGKLAPAAIAWAVYSANRRQSAWNNAVSSRAALVEDQKFRLSLLDRRASVIDAIRHAWIEFSSVGEANEAVISKLDEALTGSELIFEVDEYAPIGELKRELILWHVAKRQYERWIQSHKADEAELKVTAIEERLLALFESVPEKLRAAAQIKHVPPLLVEEETSGWHIRSPIYRS